MPDYTPKERAQIVGDGITFDMPQDLALVKTFFTFARCVVNVRPHAGWNGENYGFDWVRIGDMSGRNRGDCKYYQNVGRYTNQTDKNDPDSGTFKRDASLFRSMLSKYYPDHKCIVFKMARENISASDSEPDKLAKESLYYYYIPVMTLRKDKSAQLDLMVELDTTPNRAAPTRIEICPSGEGIYTPSITQIDNPATGTYSLTLSCNEQTSEDQTLAFYAVYTSAEGKESKEICGLVRILPNARKRRLKVLFVNLKFKSKTGSNIDGEINKGHITFVEHILNQAMVDLDSETLNYDVPATIDTYDSTSKKKTSSPTPLLTTLRRAFDGITFSDTDRVWGGVFNGYGLYGYLHEKGLLNKYSDYMMVVCLGAKKKQIKGDFTTETPGSTLPISQSEIFIIDPNTGESTGSVDLNSTHAILMFAPSGQTTLVHEILHGIGLFHSFNNVSDYSYIGKTTDNIMDYSHNAKPPIPRISIWQWQWKALWDYCDKISQIDNQRLEAAIGDIPEPDFGDLERNVKEKIKQKEWERLEAAAAEDMANEAEN